jgi:hypothetical protein
MNPLKLCIPAALVAVIAMATFGPSAAMGGSTALCSTDEQPCSEANQVEELHLIAENMIVTTQPMTYECEALLSASALGLGDPEVLHGSFTYLSCNNGCDREEISEGTTIEVLRTEEEAGTVVASGFEVRVHCAGVIECTYTFEGAIGYILGALQSKPDGSLNYHMEPLQHLTGVLDICPQQGYLTALFEPLSPIYVKS